MTPLQFEYMDERQLNGALGGAMAWQLIVQDRGCGPDECMEAARQTERVLRARRKFYPEWVSADYVQHVRALCGKPPLEMRQP